MSKWKDLRKELDITPEEENVIELEKELIRAMVTIREEQGLSQAELAWRVENLNEKEMPFAIGAHPGFMMPGDESHVFRLYDRQGKPVQSIENRIFAGGGCVTDRTEEINTPEGVLPITDHLFDGDALVIENEQLGAVELVKNGKDNPIITVSFNAPLKIRTFHISGKSYTTEIAIQFSIPVSLSSATAGKIISLILPF